MALLLQRRLNPFLRKQFHRETYVMYYALRGKNMLSDQEIEVNLLSEENRQTCMEKMRRATAVGAYRRGAKSESKFAAVLIALCTDVNMQNISLLYTRRSHLLSRHMRQISFPGGIKEDNEDFVQCALRETEEETGLPWSRVEIWGSGNLIKPPNMAAIMPVIGVVKDFKQSELNINKAEVEEAFVIPIKRLTSPPSLRYTQFKRGYSLPVFLVGNKRIWGITAIITNIFLRCFLPPELINLQNCVKFISPFKGKSST